MRPALKNQRSRRPFRVVRVATHAGCIINRDSPVLAGVGTTAAFMYIFVADLAPFTGEIRRHATAETLSERRKQRSSEEQ
jgi:hypothetical protein